MKPFFSKEGQVRLSKLLGSHSLLAFDYDGTLAPLKDKPEEAKMNRTTYRLLKEVASLYPCAVVTGRSLKSIAPFLKGIPLCYAVGNHGLETKPQLFKTARFKKQVARWKKELRPLIQDLPGVWVEDKALSLSLHFREASNPKQVEEILLKRLPRVRIPHLIRGKCVMNLLPTNRWNKGTAVEKLIRAGHFKQALFVGDDRTDEFVFSLKRDLPLLTIHIGQEPWSKADFSLKEQKAIDPLLREILKG